MRTLNRVYKNVRNFSQDISKVFHIWEPAYFLNPQESPQSVADFQLLLNTSLQTAYLFLANANNIDSSSEEIVSYMKKISQELRMDRPEIIMKARGFFDKVDAIDLVEECDKLLNADQNSLDTT